MMWPFMSGEIMVEGSRVSDASVLSKVHADAFAHNWRGDELQRMIESDNVRALQCRRPSTWLRPASLEPKGFVLARVAADEAEILTLAVTRDARGLGLGKALMRAIMSDLYADRINSLFLEVDETNEAAVGLYLGLNFTEVGERKSYYKPDKSAGDETRARPRALVMRADLR